jgi:O-antigen/teichoic acid export membrane protein
MIMRRIASVVRPGMRTMACLDQAVVSATNFLPLFLIARVSGAAEAGSFALAWSMVALTLAAQEALVTRPHAVRIGRRPASRTATFDAVILSGLIAAVMAVGLAAGLSALIQAESRYAPVVLAIVVAVPALLVRELGRRHALAQEQVGQALLLDVVVGVVMLLALVAVTAAGALSAVTAISAVAAANATAGLLWLWRVRGRLRTKARGLQSSAAYSWKLGRWLLVGQVALQVQGYGTYWLIASVGGPAATGLFAACLSIISLSNPVVFGVTNVLTPACIRAMRTDGRAGLIRQSARHAIGIGLFMSAFLGVVFWGGEWLMELFYPRPEYRGQSVILTMLALAALAAAVGVPASMALASVERVRPVAFVMSMTAAATLLLVGGMSLAAGLWGAAVGVLIAECLGSLARWTALIIVTRGPATSPRSAPRALVRRALEPVLSAAQIRKTFRSEHA